MSTQVVATPPVKTVVLETIPCPNCWACPGVDPADENGTRVCPSCDGQTVIPDDMPEAPEWTEEEMNDFARQNGQEVVDIASTLAAAKPWLQDVVITNGVKDAAKLTPADLQSLRNKVASLTQYIQQAEDASNLGLSGAGLLDILQWLAIHALELGDRAVAMQARLTA
jgi:hypothetical protein